MITITGNSYFWRTAYPGRFFMAVEHTLHQKSLLPGIWMQQYGPALTPYARVLASPDIRREKKNQLRALKGELNAFELEVIIQNQLKQIDRLRRAQTWGSLWRRAGNQNAL
jgi:hypothetical protein